MVVRGWWEQRATPRQDEQRHEEATNHQRYREEQRPRPRGLFHPPPQRPCRLRFEPRCPQTGGVGCVRRPIATLFQALSDPAVQLNITSRPTANPRPEEAGAGTKHAEECHHQLAAQRARPGSQLDPAGRENRRKDEESIKPANGRCLRSPDQRDGGSVPFLPAWTLIAPTTACRIRCPLFGRRYWCLVRHNASPTKIDAVFVLFASLTRLFSPVFTPPASRLFTVKADGRFNRLPKCTRSAGGGRRRSKLRSGTARPARPSGGHRTTRKTCGTPPRPSSPSSAA